MERLRVASYDSDSSSCFSNPQQEESKEANEAPPDEDCPWRSAVDPASGKTYYYHVKTRETQWRKPMEMASREEREALAAKERRQKEFFAAMEANILNSISQGYKAPEKKNRLDLEFENKEISDDPLAINSAATSTTAVSTPLGGSGSGSGKQVSPRKPRAERRMSNSSRFGGDRSRPNLVRTISSMDTNVLMELMKRVPSSRQVSQRGGNTMSTTRTASSRSMGGFGSSHHSRQGRLTGQRSIPRIAPVSKKIGVLSSGSDDSKKKGVTESGEAKETEVDDDDDLPPLTVVTTPDLRKRESLGLDALAAQDPRDKMTRRDSLTLDQLSFHAGGGNLMDSRFFDQSTGSRLTMSNHSFNLDPNDSTSHHSGGSGGGYLSHLGASMGRSHSGFANNQHSFTSYDSSDSHSFGALDASHNGMSVASNPLHPVEEALDESELSNPKLKVDTATEVVLEGDRENEDSPEEGSFSLGGDGDFQADTTANWLDALPPDDAGRVELVGYGDDAKRFSDAGFTSFFDESMANFDLSDKETQALQKLAVVSEQMTKLTETDESDETDDESDDIDDSDLNVELNDGPKEFSLLMESEEELVMGDASSEENEGNLSPSLRTPITNGTTKTSGTTSTAESSRSPVHRPPPRRTLGPRNTRISRAQRNLARDGVVTPPESPANSLNLAFASATLTIDNARSHYTEPPRGSAAALGRRQGSGDDAIADIEWSPVNETGSSQPEDGRPPLEQTNSSSSINSNSSIAMANAARRLSLFRLKNIDRSRLRSAGSRSTSGGKGGLANALSHGSPDPLVKSSEHGIGSTDAASTGADGDSARPTLSRRNTCGTLYVGTTMSAPDKDATIKCVCGVYRAHILQSEMEGDGPAENMHIRIFNDLESQQSFRRLDMSRRPTKPNVPSLEQITTFYRDVFQRAQMEYDCIIISLIYVERLIKTSNGALRPRACNWRSILFSCMVLASKVWDDMSMWNADFSQTCPNGVKFPLRRINELEVAILSALSYKVKVPASEYAKYYFLLRSMLIKSGLVGDNIDTTTPLDVEGAKRLQQVSTQFQSGMGETRRQMRKAKSLRSKSMGDDERWKVSAAARKARVKNKKVSLEHVVKM